jgi:hypothetical protein
VLGRDPRGGAERDEPEVAPLVPGRAIIEVKVRMADLAVVGSVAVVLGLEIEDSHRGIAYPLVAEREHGAVSSGGSRGISAA